MRPEFELPHERDLTDRQIEAAKLKATQWFTKKHQPYILLEPTDDTDRQDATTG